MVIQVVRLRRRGSHQAEHDYGGPNEDDDQSEATHSDTVALPRPGASITAIDCG